MSASTDPDDIAVDNATSFIVAVPYHGQAGPVQGSYAQVLRMGAWDGGIELGIVDSNGNPILTGGDFTDPDSAQNEYYKGQDPLQQQGMLLYSANAVTAYAPLIRTVGQRESSSWTNQHTTVTTNGNTVVSYSYAGRNTFAAKYQRLDSISMTAGTATNLTLGNVMNVTSGNNAGTGIGGLLASNFGLTQNIYEGQNVTIDTAQVEVEGVFSAKLAEKESTLALDSIELAVTPAAEGDWLQSRKCVDYMRKLSLVSAVVAGGAAPLVVESLVTARSYELEKDEDKLKAFAKIQLDVSIAISSLILATQALAAVTGLTVTRTEHLLQATTPAGRLSLGRETTELSHGDNALLRLEETGDITMRARASLTVNSASDVYITTGLAAPFRPSILMTDREVELSCGPQAKIILSADGIKFVGDIDFGLFD